MSFKGKKAKRKWLDNQFSIIIIIIIIMYTCYME